MAAGQDVPFLATGGRMGRHIAEHDWSGTTLGPVVGWAPALRTAVGIMLGSPHPVLLWWGPDRTVLVNDACTDVVGERHLGGPGERVFAQEWPRIGPVVDRVLGSGTAGEVADAPLVTTRLGFPDETRWRCSCSPVRDADGRVLGVFTIVTEVTDGDTAGQRRAELAAAAENAARQVSDAAAARLQAMVQGLGAIVWEAEWDTDRAALRFTFVSDRAEELLGHPAQRWREDPDFWPTMIHPDDRAEALAVTAQRTAAGTDHDLTYRAITIDGRTLWLHQVVHVVRASDGVTLRAQGLTVDVTLQQRAERSAALLADASRLLADAGTAHQRLHALTRLIGRELGDATGVSLIGPDGLTRRVALDVEDPAIQEAMSRTAPGRLPPSLVSALAAGRPVPVPVTEELIRASSADEADASVRMSVGASSALLVPLHIDDRLVGLLGFANFGAPRYYDPADLDLAAELGTRTSLMLAADRQRSRERHMQQVSAELAAAGSVAEAASRLVDRLTDVLGAGAMSVYLVEPERGLRLVHATGYRKAMLRTYATIRLDDPVPIAQVARTGEPQWIRDRAEWERRWPDLVAEAVRSGRHAAAALPLITGGRVVGTIGISFPTEREFPADECEFVLALVTLAASAFERAATADERRLIAETLQKSLLPAELPSQERLSLAARYLPGAHGTQAGGDWYDVLPLDGAVVAIAVGDVVGQGARAAATMGQLRSALAGYLLEGHGPTDALEHLDRFASRIPDATGSTVACLVLDPESGALTWASAGHPPPLVAGPSGARWLAGAAGTVLGVRGRPPFVAGHATIEPGESVVLFTDGLVERRGEVIDDGLDRLAAAAARHHVLGPETLVDALLAGGMAGAAEDGPADDVALIVARLVPAPLHLEVPADASRLRAVRAAVRTWAVAAGLAQDDVDDLQLTLGEAAANAMEHAYGDHDRAGATVRITVGRRADGGIGVAVADHGHWRAQPTDKGHRGRGMDLIRDIGRDLELTHGPGGTEVRFTLPVQQPPPDAVPASLAGPVLP